MKHYLIFFFLLFINTSFAQDEVVKTKFIENGSIRETVDADSKVVAQFKSNQKCIVLEYFGQNIYKIQFEEAEGFVSDTFLEINDDMMDLFYDYEEREMQKLIEAEENRRKKIQDIIQEKEKRKRDSIAKIEAAERQRALAIQRAKELREKQKQDSIAEVKAAEASELARQQELERQRLEALAAKRQQDSIAEVRAAEASELARQQELQRQRLEALAAKRKQDSVVEAKAEAKRKLEFQKALERQKLEALAAKRKLDSIAKIKEAEKQRLAKELELARKQLEALKAERLKDSIARIETNENEAVSNSENSNTLLTQEELEKSKAEAKATLKFRDSCHYQMNEYDRFYNIRTIRTDAYDIAENLTIELYKQGLKTNVFFNLSESLGCASYLPNQRSSVRVTLENGQVVSFYHSWDIHCGEFLFKANLNKAKISSLEKSPIQSILLKGTEGSKELINITYKEFFMDKLKCVE